MPTGKISIVGTGYVGLCTAVAFADKGFHVITSTHDEKKMADINSAIPPFYEPGLKELMEQTVSSDHLKCISDIASAVAETEVTLIAKGTPSRSDGSIDLRYVGEAACEIGKALKHKRAYHLIVVKSTVVPGTTENLVKPILESNSSKHCGKEFGLCMSPEFLRQGSAIQDTLYPDRLVIGEYDQKSGDVLEELYEKSYKKQMPPIVRTAIPTAELIKYASNAFLATKISFINTIANICQNIPRMDIKTVAKAIGLDSRINPKFLGAGLGYGGSCFPKDVKALIAFSRSSGYNPELLQAVDKTNDEQPGKVIQLAKNNLGSLQGKRFAILGLAFKPNTSDLREARSIRMINELIDEGAEVIAYDPVAKSNAEKIFGDTISYADSPKECLKNADCCLIVTEWEELKKLTAEDYKQNMKPPHLIIDGRGIYHPAEFQGLKFLAIGVGPNSRPVLFSGMNETTPLRDEDRWEMVWKRSTFNGTPGG